jgi:hypothetical protein
MKARFTSSLSAFSLAITLLSPPSVAAQQSGSLNDGLYVAGSVLLSLLYLPVKLTTCVGTQAVTAVAYTATYGVPGSYDGGTNGKDIGEVARKACAGSWLISPNQVKRDYQ